MKAFILLLMCCLAFSLAAQEKRESERRISPDEMPQTAMKAMEAFIPKWRKLRYFQETDGTRTSYEAKFLYRGRRFSVEFSTTGILEDIEITQKYTYMPESVRDSLESYLASKFKSFDIIKCQQQYRHEGASPYNTLDQVLSEKWEGPVFYELEIDVLKEKSWYSEEYLFDQKGRFLSKRRIINRAQDNLLY
ncbi:hypothetical protein FNH22_28240 [Fulvivirga sp. M361]|uniref:hypothetical protein n=1 Tax=Fulvivirga sp. M361 TaxID=2594266 RepID=UPI00117A29FE|nr:hypothetical protein [Fulvivirga sp. M361]TRX48929.1 hypothetical protein FNH22_28240 [Fulvivirga sp. M361]